MWRERIKDFEQKQNEIYEIRRRDVKAINMKYPDVYKWIVKWVIIFAIGAALITCISAITVLYLEPGEIWYYELFFIGIFGFVSIYTAWQGRYRSKHPDYYEEMGKITGIMIKPVHLYALAILIFIFGIIFAFY